MVRLDRKRMSSPHRRAVVSNPSSSTRFRLLLLGALVVAGLCAACGGAPSSAGAPSPAPARAVASAVPSPSPVKSPTPAGAKAAGPTFLLIRAPQITAGARL